LLKNGVVILIAYVVMRMEIEELINAVKRINFGISKIESKIEQIRNICEEYNLELDKFIDVLYNFDN
jgi:hypothetical protein